MTYVLCKHPDKSACGYSAVKVSGRYCEVGEDCHPACPHSWPSTNIKQQRYASEAFKTYNMKEESQHEKYGAL